MAIHTKQCYNNNICKLHQTGATEDEIEKSGWKWYTGNNKIKHATKVQSSFATQISPHGSFTLSFFGLRCGVTGAQIIFH